MRIEVHKVEFKDVEALRGLYRHEAGCQIVHDSILRRGLAEPYLITVDGRTAGYGGVWTQHHPGRIMEFHALPSHRGSASLLFRELIAVSGAIESQAQTNMPLMLMMLYEFAQDVQVDNILFHDAATTHLSLNGAAFRRTAPGDKPPDSDADWVIESGGDAVASGGFLCHYNPPYGDIYMTVKEGERRKGFGSYLVQEVKRVCYEEGKIPSARCNPDNTASRRTLERAGLHVCARLLSGRLRPDCLSVLAPA